jgi:hypothetical protein
MFLGINWQQRTFQPECIDERSQFLRRIYGYQQIVGYNKGLEMSSNSLNEDVEQAFVGWLLSLFQVVIFGHRIKGTASILMKAHLVQICIFYG